MRVFKVYADYEPYDFEMVSASSAASAVKIVAKKYFQEWCENDDLQEYYEIEAMMNAEEVKEQGDE